jgi:hypothetical protein
MLSRRLGSAIFDITRFEGVSAVKIHVVTVTAATEAPELGPMGARFESHSGLQLS